MAAMAPAGWHLPAGHDWCCGRWFVYNTQEIWTGRLSAPFMGYELTRETFASLGDQWKATQLASRANRVFSSLAWSRVWWERFGQQSELCLHAVRNGGRVTGIAPLVCRDGKAFLLGGTDVCDYLDFIVDATEEEPFFGLVLEELAKTGVSEVDLAPVRPDSSVMSTLVRLAPRHGWRVSCSHEDVSVDMPLPASWDDYVERLESKQRHELRRKIRRLSQAGAVNYRSSARPSAAEIGLFLRLFRESRLDKAAFLTERMEGFFRGLADAMAAEGWLRLGFLELDGAPVAATFCFDYGNEIYLYNSGYDPRYAGLNAGLVAKALSIRDAIEAGRKRYDFLKGCEDYKYHLGGQEMELYRCSMRRSG